MAGTFLCMGTGTFSCEETGMLFCERTRYFSARGHSTIDCIEQALYKNTIDTFLFLLVLVAYRSGVNHTSILNNFDNVVFRIIRKFWSAF